MKTNIDELIENMFVKVAELEQNSKDEELSLQDQLKEWVSENKPELQDKIHPKDVSDKSIIQQEKESFEPQSAEVEIPQGMAVEQIIEQVLNDTSPYKEKMLVLEAVRNNRLGELKMKTDEFFQAASKGDFKKINSLKEEQDSLKTDLDKLDAALEKLYNYFATNTSTFVPKKKISQLSKRAKEKHSKKCPECSYVAFTHNGSLVCTNSRCDNYDKEANREFAKSKKSLKKDHEHLDTFTSAKHPISKRADKFIKLPDTDDIEPEPTDVKSDVKSLVDQILAPTKDNQHGALTFSEGYYNIKEWDDSTDVVYLKPIYTENSLAGYRMTYSDGTTHNVPEGEARQLVVSPLETIEASLKPLLKAELEELEVPSIEKDKDGNFFYDGFKATPLMQSFLEGNPEKMKSLIEHGANFDDPALTYLIALFYDGALEEFAPPFEKGEECANILASYLDGTSQSQVDTDIEIKTPTKSTKPLELSIFEEDTERKVVDRKTNELLENKFKLNANLISIRAKLEDDIEPTKDYPKTKRNVFYSKSVKAVTPHGNKEWKQIGDILIHPDKFTALIKTDLDGKTFYTIIDPNGKVIEDEATELP